jgi:DNA-directed RNA polymerase specialized sigma24 family protein
MSPEGSVSRLFEGLKAGDDAAVRSLWERYCGRLVGLARQKLRNTGRRVADEEDIALSAFHSLCLGARGGRFPALADRDGLWGLLVFITAQKAADWAAYARRQKRGGGKVRGHSALDGGPAGSHEDGFDRVLSQSPGPAMLNVWAEEYGRLLDRLGNETLRQVAELKVQGYTVEEIAERLGLARRTVHRKIHLIRKTWLAEARP